MIAISCVYLKMNSILLQKKRSNKKNLNNPPKSQKTCKFAFIFFNVCETIFILFQCECLAFTRYLFYSAFLFHLQIFLLLHDCFLMALSTHSLSHLHLLASSCVSALSYHSRYCFLRNEEGESEQENGIVRRRVHSFC
jgi:hypothetical protein